MISRRTFLRASAIPLITTPSLLAEIGKGINPGNGPVIKSFSIFKASGNFHRLIGMNSYDKAPKGIQGVKSLVKVVLSDGTYGIGPVGYRPADEAAVNKLRGLLGKDPVDFYHWNAGKITGVVEAMQAYFYDPRIAWFESAVLDALGKQRKMPVWQLTGESARDGVDPYDGTLYFEDIASGKGVEIIADIGKKSKKDGYRGIKIKLGRPSKWLLGAAGVQRDIDAFIALREAVGSNFVLMADANNGYANRLDWAIQLLKACAPHQLYFIEELFPDDPAEYRKLQAALLAEHLYVPIAEGESINDLELFDAYMKDGIYNYLQPDMHTCGYSNILALARKAQAFPHVRVIPHVWQSQLGLIMSLHAAKIQGNIPYVEDSRYFEHVVGTSRFLFSEGQWFIPNDPGWGVDLVPDYQQYLVDKELVIS